MQHFAGIAVDDDRGRRRRVALGMKAVISARRGHRIGVPRIVHVITMVAGVDRIAGENRGRPDSGDTEDESPMPARGLRTHSTHYTPSLTPMEPLVGAHA